MNFKNYIIGAGLMAVLLNTSCTIKEYTDPSAISDAQVVATVEGLFGLCNGLQFRYTVGRQSPIYQSFSASGLTTGELRLLNLGNTDELNLANGGSAVTGANAIVGQLWTQSFLMLNESNRVLANLSVATNGNAKAVIQGYASMYKALALGTLATYFEQMPISVGKNQSFVSRTKALEEAVVLLEGAEAALNATTNGTEVNAAVAKIAPGVDLKQSVIALQARYGLMLKNYTKALTAANKVDLTKKSGFRYDAVNTNPIFFVSYSNRNVLEPANKFLGLPAGLLPDSVNDKRLPFYINPAASNTVNMGFGFARSNTSEIPVYLPGEMRLIKVECLAQTDVTAAATELSNLIKKKPAEDAWGVAADIAAGYTGAVTKEAILTEVYRQRCLELANSGLRLEDSRRLGRPSTERSRDFFPYPQAERDNNPNTPNDPLR